MNRLISAVFVGFLISAAVWGQATAGLGTISGTVTDESGAVIPNAAVVITNKATGAASHKAAPKRLKISEEATARGPGKAASAVDKQAVLVEAGAQRFAPGKSLPLRPPSS